MVKNGAAEPGGHGIDAITIGLDLACCQDVAAFMNVDGDGFIACNAVRGLRTRRCGRDGRGRKSASA